jgi:excinuclease ABC subunit B
MTADERARFLTELEERMREAARKFEFEKAAALRDRLKALKARGV